MPNPWDAGSARLLQHLGFAALATTSAGLAWTLGKRDNAITLDDALAHFRDVTSAVTVPVNADFESGFAVAPDDVATNVRRCVETGVSGLSIEDSTGNAMEPLYDASLAVERIAAARSAIDASGTRVVLTGRTEGFFCGRPDIDETIRRLVAYADAGAECLYAPGVREPRDIEAIVKAVAPKPVNVLVTGGFATVATLRALGVRRISVGGALARAAWTAAIDAARAIAASGTFDVLEGRMSAAQIETAMLPDRDG